MAIAEQKPAAETLPQQLLPPVNSKDNEEIIIKKGETLLDLVILKKFRRNESFCYPPSDSDELLRTTFSFIDEADVDQYSPKDHKPFRIITPVFQCEYLGVKKYTELVALRKGRKKFLIEKIAQNLNQICASKET